MSVLAQRVLLIFFENVMLQEAEFCQKSTKILKNCSFNSFWNQYLHNLTLSHRQEGHLKLHMISRDMGRVT